LLQHHRAWRAAIGESRGSASATRGAYRRRASGGGSSASGVAEWRQAADGGSGRRGVIRSAWRGGGVGALSLARRRCCRLARWRFSLPRLAQRIAYRLARSHLKQRA